MKQERTRYERKGYGLTFATFFAFSFFYIVPEVIGQQYWSTVLHFKQASRLKILYGHHVCQARNPGNCTFPGAQHRKNRRWKTGA